MKVEKEERGTGVSEAGKSPESLERQKRNYFEKLAFRHLPQMRALFRGGKLWKKEKWRNVAEHCLVGAAAAEVLAEALGLPEQEAEKLIRDTAFHDWDKRLEKRPQDFTEAEIQEADRLVRAAMMGEEPRKGSHGPWANGRFDEISFEEQLERYIDNLLNGSEIVDPVTRLTELAKRRGDLSKDPEFADYDGDLSGFWDREIANAIKVQKELFERLKARGADVASPEDVPEFVKREIARRIAEQ